jgi:hypothetical protein
MRLFACPLTRTNPARIVSRDVYRSDHSLNAEILAGSEFSMLRCSDLLTGTSIQNGKRLGPPSKS